MGKRLRHLSRNANLENPEKVKDFIASKQCSNGFKESLVEAYDLYANFRGLQWNKPFYERYDKQPRIPREEKLDMLIAQASKRLALILSMSKDLATRPIEARAYCIKDLG